MTLGHTDVQVVSQTPDRDQLDQKLAALGEIAQKKPSALRDLLEDIWTYLLMLMAPPKQGSLSRRLTANPLSDLPFHEWRGLGQLASEMFIELAVAFPEEFQQPSRKHLLKDFVGSQIGAEISQLADHGDAHDWIVATEVSRATGQVTNDRQSMIKRKICTQKKPSLQ